MDPAWHRLCRGFLCKNVKVPMKNARKIKSSYEKRKKNEKVLMKNAGIEIVI